MRRLVKAIDSATDELDALRTDVPLSWLKTYDSLSSVIAATKLEQLPFGEVAQLAATCGMPHQGLTLEVEVSALLRFFHGLGVLCWFDEPELREIVVLDPKWIIDALTCVIREFSIHPKGSSSGCATGDYAAIRDCKKDWTALEQKGELRPLLYEYLWFDAQFKGHHAKILRLMVLFGLAVPVPNSDRSKDMLIVPSLIGMNAAADQADDNIDDATRHMVECIITFEQSGDVPSDSLLCDYAETVRTGYVPRGLLHQLWAIALAWSLQSAPTKQPVLGSNFARVYFGRHSVYLIQRSDEQAIRMRLSKPDSAAALLLRLQLLLDEVLRRRFPKIRACFRLHDPTSTDDMMLINVATLERPSTEDVIAIKRQLMHWFPPEQPPDEYDVFISYRQKQAGVFTFDSRFADLLSDCLAAHEKMVFLDKRWPSLQEGQALDTAFLLAMANSRLVMPLISWSAMRRMTKLTEHSEVDYVLLEWTMAVLLQELGVKVYPVFIGDFSGADLFASHPPQASADGEVDAVDSSGKPVCDQRSVFERMPKAVVASVVTRLESFFAKFSQSTVPEAVRSLTVYDVVAKLKGSGGALLWSLDTSHSGERTAVRDLVEHWGKEAAVAELVCKVLRSVNGSPLQFARPVATNSPSIEAKLDQVLLEVREGRAEITKGHKEIKESIGNVGSQLRSNASMLGALLQGEHDCPRWLVLLPKPKSTSKMERAAEWLKPKNWVNTTAVLQFVCPVTCTATGTGFELLLPQDWVVKYGPAIRVGLVVLKLSAAGARLAGLPVPNLSDVTGLAMDTLEKQTEYLQELSDGIAEALEAKGLGEVNTWVSEKLEGVVSEYSDTQIAEEVDGLPHRGKETVKRSYAEVKALLQKLEPTDESWEQKVTNEKSCGLVKAICQTDGSFEWVAPVWQQLYEQKGRYLLGLSKEEKEKLLKAAPSPRAESMSIDSSTSHATLQRTTTASLGGMPAVKGLIDAALTKHEVPESLQKSYVRQLLEDGYSSATMIAAMSDEDFNDIFKKPHRGLIREQAAEMIKKPIPAPIPAATEEPGSPSCCCVLQ